MQRSASLQCSSIALHELPHLHFWARTSTTSTELSSPLKRIVRTLPVCPQMTPPRSILLLLGGFTESLKYRYLLMLEAEDSFREHLVVAIPAGCVGGKEGKQGSFHQLCRKSISIWHLLPLNCFHSSWSLIKILKNQILVSLPPLFFPFVPCLLMVGCADSDIPVSIDWMKTTLRAILAEVWGANIIKKEVKKMARSTWWCW